MSRKRERETKPLAVRAARGLPAVGLLLGVMLTGLPAAHSGGLLRQAAPHRIATGDCGPSWVGAWHSSPVQYHAGELTSYVWADGKHKGILTPPSGPITSLQGRSVRMTVPPVVSGTRLRLRLSNRFGDDRLELGPVVVARRSEGAEVVLGTSAVVTFAGSRTVTVAQGDEVVSDPVDFAVTAHQPLSVSMYVIHAPQAVTRHLDNRRTSYISEVGDFTGENLRAAYTTPTLSTFHLTGVDVLAPRAIASIVAIGDSITDGAGGSADHEQRYTDALQRRLDAAGGTRRMAVLNAGIGANRLLTDEQVSMGEGGLRRLAHDALTRRGTVDVILHEGTNDVALMSPTVSAVDLIEGMKRFARVAHGLGMRVFATTITPSLYPMHSHPHATETRDAVNRWIRSSADKHFDGVFDFAAAVADPSNPHALAREFDAGDQLHLSDAGAARLAEAVDIDRLSGSPCLAERFSA